MDGPQDVIGVGLLIVQDVLGLIEALVGESFSLKMRSILPILGELIPRIFTTSVLMPRPSLMEERL